jgi:hypothetical protein
MIDWANISLKDLAGLLSEEMRKRGIETILVGGACVTIYTNNQYQSYDLDYVSYEDMKKVKNALKELGFVQKDKYFRHPDCPWVVEFVSPPVAVGRQTILRFASIKTALGSITCLTPTDSVKDRLASFYYCNDKQSLEQAISICLDQEVNLDEIKSWSISEAQKEKFALFLQALRIKNKKR